jgi:hypothetical protein
MISKIEEILKGRIKISEFVIKVTPAPLIVIPVKVGIHLSNNNTN